MAKIKGLSEKNREITLPTILMDYQGTDGLRVNAKTIHKCTYTLLHITNRH